MTKEWESYIESSTASGGGGNETFYHWCTVCEGFTEAEEDKDAVKHKNWCYVPVIKKLEDIAQNLYEDLKGSKEAYENFYSREEVTTNG